MATSEIPKSGASLLAGVDQTRSYSSCLEYSESSRFLPIAEDDIESDEEREGILM